MTCVSCGSLRVAEEFCEKFCAVEKKAVPLHADFGTFVEIDNQRMTEQDTHIIHLDTLKVGEHLFDFQLDDAYFKAIEKSELLGGKVYVHARLNLREEDFHLQMTVQGKVQVTCDRCLDPMDMDVDATEDEWDWEEKVQTIDLAWLAYELITVNLPLVHSHQSGGCNPKMAALLQDHLCTSVEDDNTDEQAAD